MQQIISTRKITEELPELHCPVFSFSVMYTFLKYMNVFLKYLFIDIKRIVKNYAPIKISLNFGGFKVNDTLKFKMGFTNCLFFYLPN